MLPGQFEAADATWGLIGAAITAAGAVIVNIIMARHKNSQDERSDLRNEWKDLSQRQQAQIEVLQTKVEKLDLDCDKCQKEKAILETRVALLEFKLGLAPAPKTGG